MKANIKHSFIAGLLGTIMMTLVAIMAPLMGMPEMSPPRMLSGMLGAPLWAGWVVHFIIGIMFAFSYTHFVSAALKIKNAYLKGIVFGIMIFAIARLVMALADRMAPHAANNGDGMLAFIGSLAGHLIFGVVVAKTLNSFQCTNTFSPANTQTDDK